MTDILDASAYELIEGLRRKRFSAAELFEIVHRNALENDAAIHAFVRLCDRSSAGVSDAKNGALAVPLAVKDNISIKGVPLTCCSRILEGYNALYDAHVIERLRAAGVTFLGQTNMDEFAFGSSTEHSCYGPTNNPWDPNRVPGGSSGGSAAAVAARLAPWALGSDTGGSIRQPASFCGVVGLKPTYGRVSRYGLVAFGSSLDQIGPLTRDVRDAAVLLNLISGFDNRDSTSVPAAREDFTLALDVKNLNGITLGRPDEYFVDGVDEDVAAAVEQAVEVLSRAGARVKRIRLPHTRYCVATYYITATAEASANLARFDGIRYGRRVVPQAAQGGVLRGLYEETRGVGFGLEAKRRIMLGTYALSAGYYDAYYLRGQKARTLISRDFEEAFTACDVIVTPTSPTTAFKQGERTDDPLAMYLSDIFTIGANLAGLPAISIPCGFDRKGLPIGLQIIGPAFTESRILSIGHVYQQHTDWHTRRPAPQRPDKGDER